MTSLNSWWKMSLLLLGAVSCGDDNGDAGDTGADAVAATGDVVDTDAGPFQFSSAPFDAYKRVDRAGMPAIATAVITSKDAYNQADPADDASGEFVPEIAAIVTALHEALDDDLQSFSLIPCAPEACLMQAAPLVVPDTLKIDPAGVAGFPNGRKLADPVIDVTLAVVLLDLTAEGQTPVTLAAVPLNPSKNDVPFLDEFPYVGEPHAL